MFWVALDVSFRDGGPLRSRGPRGVLSLALVIGVLAGVLAVRQLQPAFFMQELDGNCSAVPVPVCEAVDYQVVPEIELAHGGRLRRQQVSRPVWEACGQGAKLKKERLTYAFRVGTQTFRLLSLGDVIYWLLWLVIALALPLSLVKGLRSTVRQVEGDSVMPERPSGSS